MAHELEGILSGMRAGLGLQRALYESGSAFLQQAFQDADWFLTVAHNLLRDEMLSAGYTDATKVAQSISLANDHQDVGVLSVFGGERIVDVTQFTPRGHYVNSEGLTRNFKSMMWLLRFDFGLTLATVSDMSPEEAKAVALRNCFECLFCSGIS